jgi:hypothetical protein
MKPRPIIASRAHRCVGRRATPRRARVPPVDYGDASIALDAARKH